MSGTIIIENLTERHQQYRIDHQAVCVKVGRCFCKQGRRSTVATTIHIAGGIGKKTAPLPPAVATIPEVKRDVSGPHPKIRIHGAKAQVSTDKAKEKAKAKADSSKPGKKGGGGRKGKNN